MTLNFLKNVLLTGMKLIKIRKYGNLFSINERHLIIFKQNGHPTYFSHLTDHQVFDYPARPQKPPASRPRSE